MQDRRRFKQTKSLQDRLFDFTADAKKKADTLPSGPERDAMMKKIRQADIAANIDGWANSPGLQPPK